MTPTIEDKKVTVCDKCLRACCWQGDFMCEDAENAGTVDLHISTLTKLNKESTSYWL